MLGIHRRDRQNPKDCCQIDHGMLCLVSETDKANAEQDAENYDSHGAVFLSKH